MLKYEGVTPGFFTQQVFLIGTYDEDAKPRFAPISWVSYTWGEPPCLVVSIYGTKRTKSNIERTGFLSATIVTPDLLPFAESNNRATRDREGAKDVSIEKGQVLDVPLIAGAKFSYECRLLKTVEIGTTHTYFAQIEKTNIREDIAALDFLDLREINPVIYSPYHYFTVGEHLGEIGDYSK
ncbi:MAG: flavin reductase [Clostridiaceae bacterium]|nr:flavin reductase [Clostridiaceae bacterium]